MFKIETDKAECTLKGQKIPTTICKSLLTQEKPYSVRKREDISYNFSQMKYIPPDLCLFSLFRASVPVPFFHPFTFFLEDGIGDCFALSLKDNV